MRLQSLFVAILPSDSKQIKKRDQSEKGAKGMIKKNAREDEIVKIEER